jgi:hypothetical protein
MAVPGRRSMLISSGDSLRTLSSILSGEGFDEREQRESPFVFSPLAYTENRFFKKKSALSTESLFLIRRMCLGTYGVDGHTTLVTLCDGFDLDKVILFVRQCVLSALQGI